MTSGDLLIKLITCKANKDYDGFDNLLRTASEDDVKALKNFSKGLTLFCEVELMRRDEWS